MNQSCILTAIVVAGFLLCRCGSEESESNCPGNNIGGSNTNHNSCNRCGSRDDNNNSNNNTGCGCGYSRR